MKNLFQNSRSHWVRYSEYELKESTDGIRYVVPAAKATPHIYDPLKKAEQMVLDALQRGVMDFVSRYGLLGFMTALPTTPQFMDYEAVYLPTNHFIKEESMSTDEYTALFYPFQKLDINKRGKESRWDTTDRTMMALMMTMQDKPMAVGMGFQRGVRRTVRLAGAAVQGLGETPENFV